MRNKNEKKTDLENRDDWLPDFFYGNGKVKPANPVTTSEADAQSIKLQAHYQFSPSETERERKRYEKSAMQDARESLDAVRKIYIRGKKLNYMRLLLLSHKAQDTVKRMNQFESSFITGLTIKFEKYKKVRWITKKQYLVLIEISKRYLNLPADRFPKH
jgi:hypothetical protein